MEYKKVFHMKLSNPKIDLSCEATSDNPEELKAFFPRISEENGNDITSTAILQTDEYEDGRLIRSYEGTDPSRSTEFVLSTINNNNKFFGIYVYIYTRDEHDELNPVNEPPHVHILNLNKVFVCKVNITGECPRSVEAMRPCIFKVNDKLKGDEISKLIPKIVSWADYNRRTARGIIKNWDFAKEWWKKNVDTVSNI